MLVALLAPAPLPADQIAPPLGRPIQVTTTETRAAGQSVRRFVLVRTVTFVAEADGFRATVRLLRASAQATGEERRMFEMANAGLLDRPVIVHLDRSGQVSAVDDEAAVWQAWLGGIAALGAGSTTAKAHSVEAGRHPLANLPPERRKGVLASSVTALFAPASERVPSAGRAVRFDGGVYNGAAALSGTATSISDHAAIRTDVHATSTPAGSADTTVELTLTKRVDPNSGLLLSSVQKIVTQTAHAGVLVREIKTQVD